MAGTAPSEEPKKKSKKDKKKAKSAEASEESTESSPASKDEKKKKRKTEDAELESVASSSRTVASAPSKAEVEQFLTDNSVAIHGTTPLIPIISFAQLDVPEGLRAACDNFEKPTPIQACSWPAALASQDVVGIAETGRLVFRFCIMSDPADSLYTVARPWPSVSLLSRACCQA